MLFLALLGASSTSKASCRRSSCLPNKGRYVVYFPTVEQLTRHSHYEFSPVKSEANYKGSAALGVKAMFWSHIHFMIVVSLSGAQNLKLLSVNRGSSPIKS